MKDKAEDAIDNVKDSTKDAAHKAKNTVEEVKDSIEPDAPHQSVSSSAERSGGESMLERAKGWIYGTAKRSADDEPVEAKAEETKEKTETLMERAKDWVSGTSDSAQDLKDKAEKETKEQAENMKEGSH